MGQFGLRWTDRSLETFEFLCSSCQAELLYTSFELQVKSGARVVDVEHDKEFE